MTNIQSFRFILLLSFTSLMISCGGDNDSNNSQNNIFSNELAVGNSARELLSDDNFTRLQLEIVYVNGARPENTSISNLRNFIQQRTFKPDGIQITERELTLNRTGAYSINEVREIEAQHRQQFSNGNTIAVFALFLEESSDSDSNNTLTLGSAYQNTSIVIYQETVEEFSGGLNEPPRIAFETTVLNHEFSHLLGLVNLGTPLQSDHEDGDTRHCNVDGCLMLASIENVSPADMLNMMNNGIPSLDAQCIADLQANGGR